MDFSPLFFIENRTEHQKAIILVPAILNRAKITEYPRFISKKWAMKELADLARKDSARGKIKTQLQSQNHLHTNPPGLAKPGG